LTGAQRQGPAARAEAIAGASAPAGAGGAAGPAEAGGADRGVRRLRAAVFVSLVIASFAAFFIAQRLKHTPTAIQLFYVDPVFHPEGGPKPHREAITFRLQRPDHVTVEIWSSPEAGSATASTVVATLVSHRVVAAYTPLELTWNGRLGAHRDGNRRPTGPPAPAGEYRVMVILSHQKVEQFSPHDFTLVRKGRR